MAMHYVLYKAVWTTSGHWPISKQNSEQFSTQDNKKVAQDHIQMYTWPTKTVQNDVTFNLTT